MVLPSPDLCQKCRLGLLTKRELAGASPSGPPQDHNRGSSRQARRTPIDRAVTSAEKTAATGRGRRRGGSLRPAGHTRPQTRGEKIETGAAREGRAIEEAGDANRTVDSGAGVLNCTILELVLWAFGWRSNEATSLNGYSLFRLLMLGQWRKMTER